jgi:uroporphyrinogen decarboxylase
MNPRERVRMAIRHQQPDLVPWNLGLTAPALTQLAAYCGDPRLADGHYFAEWVGNHFRSVSPRGTGQFHGLEEEVEPGLWRDGWGVVWDTRGLYGEGEWGRPVNCVLPEPTLAGYTFPEPPDASAFAHYARFTRENQSLYLVASAGHLFEVAWALRGMESFFTDMVLHPEFVDELLDGITAYYLGIIDRSVQYEVDAVRFGDDWGSQTMGLMMGPRHWRRYLKPHLARMFARVKRAGKATLLHSDGQVDEVFEDLIEIGLDVYNPFQPEIMDVYGLKVAYGERLCFLGGIGVQELLPHGTPQQVKAEARRMIQEVGAGGGYILSPAHAVMADIPAENVAALIEAVQEQ